MKLEPLDEYLLTEPFSKDILFGFEKVSDVFEFFDNVFSLLEKVRTFDLVVVKIDKEVYTAYGERILFQKKIGQCLKEAGYDVLLLSFDFTEVFYDIEGKKIVLVANDVDKRVIAEEQIKNKVLQLWRETYGTKRRVE